MAKISREYCPIAELVNFLFETILETLNNSGRPVMARNLELSDDYFGQDETKKINPVIKKFLGTLKTSQNSWDLMICAEINWYAPGKIYVGLIAENEQGTTLTLDSQDYSEIKNAFGNFLDQEPMDNWIYWRYITINGETTSKTNNGAVPHFKVPNDALRQLDNEKVFAKFSLALIAEWNRISEKFSEISK